MALVVRSSLPALSQPLGRVIRFSTVPGRNNVFALFFLAH
jgi:hypothetical protein